MPQWALTGNAMEEIKQGYKQTDIGVIPEDWEVKNILNISPLQRGFDLPICEIKEGKFPVVFSNGIFKFHSKYMAKKPGVVTGRSGTIGKVFFIENDYWPHNTTLWVTNFKGNNPKFIYYLFEHTDISIFSSGSGVPTLNRNDIHERKVALPITLAEQTAIATALSDVDALIAALDKKITKKQQIKQGAMQQLLTGKKRLLGFRGENKFKQTEIGFIPEDWNMVSVGDITKFHKQGYYTKENYKENGEYYLLRGTDMQNPKIDLSSTPKISVSQYDYEAYKVLNGDFLFVRSGAIGRYGIADANTPKSIFGSYLINFRFIEDINAKYFGYFYESEISICQLYSIIQGGANLNINAENIKALKIPLPPLAEQIGIAQILTDIDNEISQLVVDRNKYEQIKTGMMQQLLTGKIRLIKN